MRGAVKKIRITLLKDGTQKIEVLGAAGDACLEFTRALEKRLGAVEGERTLKPEFHEAAPEVDGESELERGT